MLRRLAGWLIALLARVLTATLRVSVFGEERVRAQESAGRPVVFVFWHGRQLLLYAYRRPRGYAVMVSQSRDGELQAAALRHFGARPVRGSSSRDGALGLVRLAREVRAGHTGLIAADGPRGPLYRCKPGALSLARSVGAVLVPLTAAARRRWVLRRAWDRFRIPWPGTRTVVVVGEPLEVPPTARGVELERLQSVLEERLKDATREADRLAGHASEAELASAVAA